MKNTQKSRRIGNTNDLRMALKGHIAECTDLVDRIAENGDRALNANEKDLVRAAFMPKMSAMLGEMKYFAFTGNAEDIRTSAEFLAELVEQLA